MSICNAVPMTFEFAFQQSYIKQNFLELCAYLPLCLKSRMTRARKSSPKNKDWAFTTSINKPLCIDLIAQGCSDYHFYYMKT